MHAIAFHRHGAAEVLESVELDTPTPTSNQVRVRVKAVALNHLDLWVRTGWPGLKLEMPHVLGSDIAGTIDACGPDVVNFRVGDEVMVNPGRSCGVCRRCLQGEDNLCPHYGLFGEDLRGGYAEFICVPQANLVKKPKSLSFEQAACIPLTFLTSWHMLKRRACLEPAEVLLVHAAGSGVGSAAVQIAKLLGATVIATASSDEKLAHAEQLGADFIVNYKTHDFLSEVKRITNRAMLDVVFEHVGADTFNKSIACLKRGGRLVTCGATSGREVTIDLNTLFYKRLSYLGSTMGRKADLLDIVSLVEQNKLKPVLDRVLPLSEAKQAHAILKERQGFGKVVLTP